MVARQLGWMFLDTGAMYRALAWKVSETHLEATASDRLAKLSQQISIDLHWSGDRLRVTVDGDDVSDQLRQERISDLASAIAIVPEVRQALVSQQRALAAKYPDIITEGRDQGSVAFVDADLKIFLDASVQERAKRRHRQLSAQGLNADYDQILAGIKNRDLQDQSRATAPLVVPASAVRLDTTELTVDQMVSRVLELIEQTRSG